MLRVWEQPGPADIAPRINDFLRGLPGPIAIHVAGRDPARCRVLVTLSHGNEPSGLEAVQRWLLSGTQPAVNIVVIFGAVAAAAAEPLFFHRMLPGERDLNRCFTPPYEDCQGELAQAILSHIRRQRPEAVIDLHNTSGSSPAFAVTCGDAPAQRQLVGLFVEQLVVTDLRLGSLMEQELGCPVVTIEAGGSQDEQAEVTADRGLARYFGEDDVFAQLRPITLFKHPLRLELSHHSRIDYAQRALHDRDITVRDDIEQFNFAPVHAGEMLGWLDEDGLDHLLISGGPDDHPPVEYFRVEDGQLYPRRTLRVFMATTRPDIAASDCLFYFIPED
ncbi:MAG: succinylglutamate desuccinylase/aspartoacylase family protein [Gammaproteobacteria bacterium]|nr:succinylglutamate desuccinylase/aspartoacylase family protein [Gammaproteobacteria bacterium]